MFCSKNIPLRRFLRLVIICGSIWLATATPSKAQNATFFLDLEVSQGLFFTEGVTPYTFSVQLHPTVGLGDDAANVAERKKLELSGSIGLAYTNPGWPFLWGGRISLRIMTIKKMVKAEGMVISETHPATIHFLGKGLAQNTDFRRVAGGISINVADGIFQVSPQVGRDYEQKRNFFEIFLGTDMKLLEKILFHKKSEQKITPRQAR